MIGSSSTAFNFEADLPLFPTSPISSLEITSMVLLSCQYRSLSPFSWYLLSNCAIFQSCRLIILQISCIRSPSFSIGASQQKRVLCLIANKFKIDLQQMGKKIKTCLIGDSSVGKTSILLRIIDGCFKENNPSTIGADYKNEVRQIEGENVSVELWDTSGQDKYRSVAKNFFRGSDGIFIVFSLADDNSLKGLEYWIEQVKEVLDPSVPKILLGNKCDLKPQPSPQAKKIIKRLQQHQGYKFYAVSAKAGTNTKQAYQSLLKLSYRYMKSHGTSESIFIPAPPPKKKESCC